MLREENRKHAVTHDEGFQFTQVVWEAGYTWREGADPKDKRRKGAFLQDGRQEIGPALFPTGTAARRITPKPELFLKLAALDATDRRAIQDFVNEYGFLAPALLGRIGEGFRWGELYTFQASQIRIMSEAVALWKAVKDDDRETLTHLIHWEARDLVIYRGGPQPETQAVIASGKVDVEVRPQLLKRMEYGDVVMPARLYLQAIVNENLAKFVAPRLLWSDRKRMRLYIVPTTLMGFMWYSFASAVAQYQTFRNCTACGVPMMIAPTGGRANKLTCSNSCRTQVYQGRIAEAQRLARSGHSTKAIADQLGTTQQTITTWVRKGRKVSGKKTRSV